MTTIAQALRFHHINDDGTWVELGIKYGEWKWGARGRLNVQPIDVDRAVRGFGER